MWLRNTGIQLATRRAAPVGVLCECVPMAIRIVISGAIESNSTSLTWRPVAVFITVKNSSL